MAHVMDELGWTEAIDVLANAVESWNDDFMLCKTNVDYYKSKNNRLKNRLNESRVKLACLTTELWTIQETIQKRDSEIIELRQENDDLYDKVASLTRKLEESSSPAGTKASAMVAGGQESNTSMVSTTYHESPSAIGDIASTNAKTGDDNASVGHSPDPSWQNHHVTSRVLATAMTGTTIIENAAQQPNCPNRSNKFVFFRRLRFWKKKN